MFGKTNLENSVVRIKEQIREVTQPSDQVLEINSIHSKSEELQPHSKFLNDI